MDTKRCPKCEHVLPRDAFAKASRRKDGLQVYCRACFVVVRPSAEDKQTYMKAYYAEHRERLKQAARDAYRADVANGRAKAYAYRDANRERFDAANKASALKRKIAALDAYGGSTCSCCGESTPAFLSLDHTNNDGASHRKETGAGSGFYQWLKRNNYPQDLGLRVLCFNCNQGRRVNGGICPHEAP